MTDLEKLINHAYEIFSQYQIGKSLSVCKFCCVSDEEENILINTPLRELTAKELYYYYNSARDYSDKELKEMKYFLPRVLALVADFQFPSHSVEITFQRLDLNEQEKWEKEEIELLNNFAKFFFSKALKQFPLQSNHTTWISIIDIDEILIMFAIAHFDLNPLLLLWGNSKDFEALLHLSSLIIEGNLKFKKSVKAIGFSNSFSNDFTNKTFINWLYDKETITNFKSKIEHLIIENKKLTTNQENLLSWCYEHLDIPK